MWTAQRRSDGGGPYVPIESCRGPTDLSTDVIVEDVNEDQPQLRWHQAIRPFIKVAATKQEDQEAIIEPDLGRRAYQANGFKANHVASATENEAFQKGTLHQYIKIEAV